MSVFDIGDGVRQKSTGGTGKVIGTHPPLPPSTGRTVYSIAFNFDRPTSRVPEADLELFQERRRGDERRKCRDRRRVVIVKYQGQCVLQCLAKILDLPLADVQTMFDESPSGQRDPSDLNHVTAVLMENDYMVGLIADYHAELHRERCFVALVNDTGLGHAVVVLEDNTIFDPEGKFSETRTFREQYFAFGWTLGNVLLIKKLNID